MRFLLISVLFLAAFSSTAQKKTYGLNDDLVKNKSEILAKYLPMDGGQFLFATYALEPNELLTRIDLFKKDIQNEVKTQKDPALKRLMIKDMDYFIRNSLQMYMLYYGMDSVANNNLEKIFSEKLGAADFNRIIDSAYQAVYKKRLSQADIKLLGSIVRDSTSMSDAALFKRSGAYRGWIDNHISELLNTKYRNDTILGYRGQSLVKMRIVGNEVKEPFIKECLSFGLAEIVLKMIEDSAARKEAYERFSAVSKNQWAKSELDVLNQNFQMMHSNGPSPDFEYMSVDNKLVSLQSLRGKYVYIDVWATWCGPCKAEIPFLQKLEKDYHGKNIQFVSLSVDRIQDKKMWEDFVRGRAMGGIQLIADKDFNSSFIKKYNIASIPRFILIDPNGNIVAADALRPSNPDLRKLLDKLL